MTIAKKVEDGFKNLSYDIGKFSTDFTDYLEKKNQDLTKEADGYKKEIDKYQGEVNRCVLLLWQPVFCRSS